MSDLPATVVLQLIYSRMAAAELARALIELDDLDEFNVGLAERFEAHL